VAGGRGSSIVILGGGFGGLTVANQLRRQLGREHQITLIDKKPQFSMGFATLWVLSGRREPGEGARDLGLLEAKGINFVQSEVTRIDTSGRRVSTAAGDFAFDYLIVALGADLSPEGVPGFSEGAHNLYTLEGAAELRKQLQRLDRGKLLVVISGMPFKCPSAPYEAAMLMDDILRIKQVRDRVDIQVFTPELQPLPVAGPAVGVQVKALLSERGIGFNPGSKPKQVDGRGKSVSFENGTKVGYDLLAGVPTHVAPKVVKDSGLAGSAGWIPVDKRTLQTAVPNVFAVGDVASMMTANNLLLPRVGVLAEEEARVVASNIASQIQGVGASSRFEGRGTCFVEVGGGKASLAQGEFLAEPSPKITLEVPSARALEMKREFEASRLASWF
jgi:sulfide:quinone oxidoreductase